MDSVTFCLIFVWLQGPLLRAVPPPGFVSPQPFLLRQFMEVPLLHVEIVGLIWLCNHWQLHLWATGDIYDGKINFSWYKRVQDRA